MKPFGKSLAVALIGGGTLGGYFFGSELVQNARFARAAERVTVDREKLASATDLSTVFRTVGKVVEPSVVNIRVTKTIKGHGGLPPGQEDMLRRFFPDRDGDGEPDIPEGFGGGRGGEEFQQEGTGSGVIMDIDGSDVYILTNNHVAGGAGEIVVTLSDGRQIEDGKVLGTDPKTDLAVVKIKADRVIAAKWGDSSQLEKGDWVMAFGSPFGYVGSMTHGIVSALNRTNVGILGQQGYENFIQVDAPINPGNSGGPLTNVHGEVVGVNTAIASRTGSFSGIGFAIPSNMAKRVYGELREHGKVVRGWLGVGIRDVTQDADVAKSFGFKGDKGVLVYQTFANTPAQGKLQAGDIVVAANGKSLDGVQDLRESVAAMAPGAKLTLTVFRKGKTQDVDLRVGEQPDDLLAVAKPGGPATEKGQGGEQADHLGLSLRSPSRELAEQLNLDADAKGAVVVKVQPGSAAARAGFRPGDVITRVGDEEVNSAEEAGKALAAQDGSKGIRFYVENGDTKRFVFVKAK